MNAPLIFAGLGAIAAAYLAGRYSAPERIKVETVTVERVVERVAEQKQTEQVRVITKVERPNGTIVTRTRVESKSDTNLVESKDSHTTSHTQREVENRRGVSLALIGGLPLAEIARGPVIGAAASIPIMGPFFIGPVLMAPPMLFLGVQGGFTF